MINTKSTALNRRLEIYSEFHVLANRCANEDQRSAFPRFASLPMSTALSRRPGGRDDLISPFSFPDLQNAPAAWLRSELGRARLTDRCPTGPLMVVIDDLVDPEHRLPFIRAIVLQ
jgi:hypothetical protein